MIPAGNHQPYEASPRLRAGFLRPAGLIPAVSDKLPDGIIQALRASQLRPVRFEQFIKTALVRFFLPASILRLRMRNFTDLVKKFCEV